MNGAAIIAVYKGKCREERKYNLFQSVYEVIANEQKLACDTHLIKLKINVKQCIILCRLSHNGK